MSRNFGAFVRLFRREPALLAVSLTAGLLMAGLSGCGANPAPSSSSNSGSNSTPQPSYSNQATTGPATTSPARRIPAYFSNAEDAKPFPTVLDPKRFSDPAVIKAYSYARDLPEVFSQQPCFCNCDLGVGKYEKPHRSLLDCFASDHGAT